MVSENRLTCGRNLRYMEVLSKLTVSSEKRNNRNHLPNKRAEVEAVAPKKPQQKTIGMAHLL